MKWVSLADLDARIQVFSGELPRCGVFAARKALARVAAAEAGTLGELSAEGVTERHCALQDRVDARLFRDERAYLTQALELPEIPSDLAQRIYRGEATLADAATVVSMQDQWGTERGRILGALNKFTRKLNATPETMRATEQFVNERLKILTANDFALADNSFSTFCSKIRRAVRLVDIHSRRRLSESLLTGSWKALLGFVSAEIAHGAKLGGPLARLWPLIDFCYRREIDPEDVTDDTVRALLADLEQRCVAGPFDTARKIVYAWENLQRAVPEFPQARLGRLYREGGGRPYPVGFNELPAAFRDDWTGFVEEFGEPIAGMSLADCVVQPDDPDDDDSDLDEGYEMQLYSAKVLSNMRTTITYAANAAMAAGLSPTCLEDVITPEILNDVIVAVRGRQREKARVTGSEFHKRNSTLRNHASAFLNIARDLGLDAGLISQLRDKREKVDPKFLAIKLNRDGTKTYTKNEDLIGPRHRARLKQFDNPVCLLRWYEVMSTLEYRSRMIVEQRRTPTPEEVKDMIACVLHAITRTCLFRRANIANLRIASVPELGIEQNLVVPTRGQGKVHIPAGEVKNRKALTFMLPEWTCSILWLYIKYFRPTLMANVGADPNNPYLFPMRGMDHRDAGVLNRDFVSRNWNVGRLILNLHVQRHICSKAILDQAPTKMAIVQKMLGHKNRSTTEKYYAEVSSLIAQREYLNLLEAAHRDWVQSLGVEG